jgi:membrane dipeptidase
LEGSLRVVDMLLTEIEKTDGAVSIIRTTADLPTRPDRNHVRVFLDLEGGSPIQYQEPEPEFHPERRLAMLRNFFRLGVRGMQLTHNGRNMLGVGIAEGKVGSRLSEFGVEVVREMNRLGMMVGVSHLSAAGIDHATKISTKPVVSTHTNIQRFINTPRQHSDDEVKAIASTGGIVGVRYIAGETEYGLLADEIDYLVRLVGAEHVGIGWLGHDIGHPRPGMVPARTNAPKPSGTEGETMFQHWHRLIGVLEKRGYSEQQIALFLGGNFLRIWKDILPQG